MFNLAEVSGSQKNGGPPSFGHKSTKNENEVGNLSTTLLIIGFRNYGVNDKKITIEQGNKFS